MTYARLIKLVGGPVDGQERMWDGGPVFEVAERPALLDAEPVTTDAVFFVRHMYRQHSRWPDLFVWEPQ